MNTHFEIIAIGKKIGLNFFISQNCDSMNALGTDYCPTIIYSSSLIPATIKSEKQTTGVSLLVGSCWVPRFFCKSSRLLSSSGVFYVRSVN